MGGLTFLYPVFLAGLAALSVPIILHLIFKFRRKPVVFPTLRFLRVTTQKNARRLRLKELLLLALRLLIFALLALAFARPYFQDSSLKSPLIFTFSSAFRKSNPPISSARYSHRLLPKEK